MKKFLLKLSTAALYVLTGFMFLGGIFCVMVMGDLIWITFSNYSYAVHHAKAIGGLFGLAALIGILLIGFGSELLITIKHDGENDHVCSCGYEHKL